VNLTSLVSPHLKAMGDANWKERQAGITAVDEVCNTLNTTQTVNPNFNALASPLWVEGTKH
jgi:hypothetical protein